MTSPPPAWQRRTPGEHRWPGALAIAVAVAIQLVLPERVQPQVQYLLPGLEAALLIGLVAADPFRIDRQSTVLRRTALLLMALVVLSTGWSAMLLVADVVRARAISAPTLLSAGGEIWLTNVLTFALVYWELDRGGPAARAAGTRELPDLLFVQMTSPELAAPDWEPTFADYLYLSYTNATAFSPTDVMPLSRVVKAIMGLQSAVALIVVLLVLARAVNVLT